MQRTVQNCLAQEEVVEINRSAGNDFVHSEAKRAPASGTYAGGPGKIDLRFQPVIYQLPLLVGYSARPSRWCVIWLF